MADHDNNSLSGTFNGNQKTFSVNGAEWVVTLHRYNTGHIEFDANHLALANDYPQGAYNFGYNQQDLMGEATIQLQPEYVVVIDYGNPEVAPRVFRQDELKGAPDYMDEIRSFLSEANQSLLESGETDFGKALHKEMPAGPSV